MGGLREICQCGRTCRWLVYVMLSDRLQIKLFNLDTQQLVQSNEHALTVINVGEDEGDVTNEAGALGHIPSFL